MARIRDPLGNRDSLVYDNLGNVTRTITPIGFVAETHRDLVGRDTLSMTPTDSAQTPARRTFVRTRYDVMDRADSVVVRMFVGPQLTTISARATDSTLTGFRVLKGEGPGAGRMRPGFTARRTPCVDAGTR